MTRLEITMTYAPADESMPPPPPGAISGNNVVCQNTAQTYSVPVDSGASTYTWRVPLGWTILAGQGTTTVSVLPGASSGKVCVTPSNLCGTADTACFNVSFVTAQNDLPILMDDDTLFSPYLQPDYWYVTGNPVPIDSGAYYIFTQTGDYYVKGVDTTGCVASSDTASVIVTGVHSYAEKQQIKIYPNPANDVITIESPFFKQAQVISVCDVQGQLISSINTNAKKTNVDISALSKGVYIVEVKTVNGFLVKKLIKE